jgi:SAM-dependent methyltransferase
MAERIPDGRGAVLEMGAGGGFFGERYHDVIASEILELPYVDLICDARQIPLADNSLKAIVMTNVFHHIPDAEKFLAEARRTLRPGGRIIMIEPWNTGWSRLMHARFHHEPMVTEASHWAFDSSGPVSGANAALPWIVFERDRLKLERDWPDLEVTEIERMMPLSYLLSGGVSRVSFQPGWMFGFWRAAERLLRIEGPLAIFALIVVEKRPERRQRSAVPHR